MKLCLSRNAYIRQYGAFTYILNRLDNSDQMYCDAEEFTRKLGRTPIEKSEIIQYLHSIYNTTDIETISADFDDFIAPMLASGVLLEGASEEEIRRKDKSFSYSAEHPRTEADHTTISKKEYEQIPQKVLGDYFEANPTLFDIQFDITQACTERCVHCYIPEYNPLFLPYEKICEVITQYRDMGGLGIGFSGGECMMHPDFEKILRFAYSKDLVICVLSNLTLCDDEKIELLKEVHAAVQVSLYSMKPEVHDSITQRPGSWLKTKSAIEKLHANDVPLRISCPTMKQNFTDYTAVLEYADSLKITAQTDFIMMAKADHNTSNLNNRLSLKQTEQLLHDIVNNNLPVIKEYFNPDYKNELDTPEERAEQPLCGAGTDKLCLNADGNYYPCSGFQFFPVGNCYKQTLKEVWENSPQIKYLRGLRGKDIPKCIHCKDRNYCSMCLVRNFNETGDMLKVAEHFCKVAALNHQIVDELHIRLAGERQVEHRK